MTDPLWITEADCVEALSLPEAIPALEAGLALEAAGTARNMAKTHQIWGDHHTLHAIGAVVEGAHIVGTKTWAHTAGGATPLVTLWNSETGKLEAIIEAFALGQMRTGGISGVATAHMAREDADDLAIVGTGKQAITQVMAVAAVRPLKRIRVFSPTPENRRSFIARLERLLPATDLVEATSVESAVKDAAIITLVTRAKTPVLTAAMIAPGTHLNAVGAITPEREEFTQDVFGRVSAIAVDTVDSVKSLSAEFAKRFGTGDWSAVRPLSELVAPHAVRPKGADITLFKAMGMGLSDLALGIEILKRVRAKGGGRPFPHPKPAQPRLVGVPHA
ncbi:MAG TPA: ornithine cyclodeaminase family protein [Micropepsaceae bacterium]|nr:ornithine cyclodeaminase family protein [Micropepsaceae bacterium]